MNLLNNYEEVLDEWYIFVMYKLPVAFDLEIFTKCDAAKEILRGNLLWRPSCHHMWR